MVLGHQLVRGSLLLCCCLRELCVGILQLLDLFRVAGYLPLESSELSCLRNEVVGLGFFLSSFCLSFLLLLVVCSFLPGAVIDPAIDQDAHGAVVPAVVDRLLDLVAFRRVSEVVFFYRVEAAERSLRIRAVELPDGLDFNFEIILYHF